MADEVGISVSVLKWIGAALAATFWGGSIEQRLRNKANKEDVAKRPVERDTLEQLIDGFEKSMGTKLDHIKEATEKTDRTVTVMGESLHTVQQDVAVLKSRT